MTVSEEVQNRIESKFSYHPPISDQVFRYEELRNAAKQFAYLIAERTPVSLEQSLALTMLEMTIMWANAAIARNE